MGQTGSNQLREPLENLHTELMKQAGADYDIATTSTLTYTQFLSYITKLNQICSEYKDDHGNMLVFAVKKGSDASIFWKVTVRIACVKLDSTNNTVVSHRFLNIRQFLQVFRRITYECTGIILSDQEQHNDTSASTSDTAPNHRVPPTLVASMALGEALASPSTTTSPSSATNTTKSSDARIEALEECIICLERKPDEILPCAHAYCTPCIEQWWEYCNTEIDPCNQASSVFALSTTNVVDKTCPVCRETLDSTDDTWVISDVPDHGQLHYF